MVQLPANIVSYVNSEEIPAVSEWWDSLSESERLYAISAWDEELQNRFFVADSDDTKALPVVIGGRFIPAEQSLLVGMEWQVDYFEYMLAHPEMNLVLPEFKVGVVCTAHPEARTLLEAGCIPAGFVCPFGSAECPMRRMLDLKPNHSLQLIGTGL